MLWEILSQRWCIYTMPQKIQPIRIHGIRSTCIFPTFYHALNRLFLLLYLLSLAGYNIGRQYFWVIHQTIRHSHYLGIRTGLEPCVYTEKIASDLWSIPCYTPWKCCLTSTGWLLLICSSCKYRGPMVDHVSPWLEMLRVVNQMMLCACSVIDIAIAYLAQEYI